jgi:hypothetical protein
VFCQFSKTAEDARPDSLVFVGADEYLVEALAREDVEVVEPELGHDLLELAGAEQGAGEAGLPCLLDDDPGAPTGGLDRLAVGLYPQGALGRAVLGEQLRGGHPHRPKRGERDGQRSGLRCPGRFELLAHPAFGAELRHAGYVAGARTDAEARKDMHGP